MATQGKTKPGTAARPAMKEAAAAVEKAKTASPYGGNKQAGAVAVQRPQAGAMVVPDIGVDFAADAGDGMKGIDSDSLAIPFLTVLQKMSPQCDPDQGAYNPDAKPGMFINTVSGELFDGKEGVTIVPCAYVRKFLTWAPREMGGGFKGERTPEEAVAARQRGELVEFENRLFVPDSDGSVNPKRNDKVADTRVHYCLLLNERTGLAQQVVISLTSTQIKKSKRLNSMLSEVVVDDGHGRKFHPATYANAVRATTVAESNEKGNWSGIEFAIQGLVTDAATYNMAKSFNKLVDAGRATVNFDAMADTVDADDSEASERGENQRRF